MPHPGALTSVFFFSVSERGSWKTSGSLAWFWAFSTPAVSEETVYNAFRL